MQAGAGRPREASTQVCSTREDVLVGAAAGATLSVATTAARWATWQPYDALLVPYDVVVLVAAGAVAGAVVAALRHVLGLDPGAAVRLAGALFAGAIVGLGAYAWLATLVGRGGGAGVKGMAALLGLAAGAVGVGHLIRPGGRSGLPAAWFGLACGAGVAASILGFPLHAAVALAFPAVVLAVAIPGLPVSRAGWRDAALPALLGVGVAMAIGGGLPSPGNTPPPPERASGSPVSDGAPVARPSVLLVVIDTLRQDHLPVYGYGRPITPRLDRWAATARVFDQATASSSWTLPSHASLFTGLSSRSHGAHGYRGDRRAGNAHPLAHEFDTLAELAAEAGYATGAIVANAAFLDPRYQLDQGFGTYWVPAPRRGFVLAPADALARRLQPWRYQELDWVYVRDRFITDGALGWLRALGERPYFLFVNYLDVHDPSARPPTAAVPLEDETPWTVHDYDWWPFLAGERPLDETVLRDVVNSYDRELEHLDGELYRLIEYVEQNASGAGTYVVVTSDHGEYFGEHGLMRHGLSVHNVVTRVPLIVKGPGVAPGRSSKPVQGIDLFPQILEWLGIAARRPVEGTGLFTDARHDLVAEWYPAQRSFVLDPMLDGRFDRTIRSLRDGGWEILADDRGGLELFDLSEPPAARRDLRAARPELASALQARLDAWLESHPPAAAADEPTAPLSPEALERLRALGYVD